MFKSGLQPSIFSRYRKRASAGFATTYFRLSNNIEDRGKFDCRGGEEGHADPGRLLVRLLVVANRVY